MHRAALNFLGGRIGQAILMRLESVLAALDVPRRALLHLLTIVTRVFHVLFAESADHDLPFQPSENGRSKLLV
jgi:hypothetical protein